LPTSCHPFKLEPSLQEGGGLTNLNRSRIHPRQRHHCLMETGELLEDWADLTREEAAKWSRHDLGRGSDGRRRQEALTRERAWPPDTNRELTMSSGWSRQRADAGDCRRSNYLLATWTGCSNGALAPPSYVRKALSAPPPPCPRPRGPMDSSSSPVVRGCVLRRPFASASSLHGQSAMELTDGRYAYALLPHCSCSLGSSGDQEIAEVKGRLDL
jgi:hypothetical protein